MPTLQLQHISKYFPGVKALDQVSITVYPGEVHALCGENGAGKSTLMNILSGNQKPDHGKIILNNKELVFNNPRQAFHAGISIVHQHLSLIESLSVAENIYANQQPKNKWGFIQYKKLYEQTQSLLDMLNIEGIKPSTSVDKLSPAQKQMVEIAKALAKNPSILILDEPTASITERESKVLFLNLQRLKTEGVSIIYISHRLEEIFQLADTISILKDGKHQGTFPAKELTKNDLIKKMVGRDIQVLKNESSSTKDVLLEVKDLTGNGFRGISFNLYKGEILGFSGLVGAGRTEIARAIFGADEYDSGEIFLNGEKLIPLHPSKAIKRGIAYVPEERKSLGLFQEMSVKDNILVSNLNKAKSGKLYDPKQATITAQGLKEKLRIVTPDVHQKVINLSGGNQQKVVLAKWLLTDPNVLIVDEPTHGIDVGAKFEIYEILQALASQGKGVIVISSELPELIGLCDRILVIRKGEISSQISREEATEEKLMSFAAN